MYDPQTNTYINDTIPRIQPSVFTPVPVPGINDPKINAKIGVELELTALDIPFDNTGTTLTSTNVQDALVEIYNLIP